MSITHPHRNLTHQLVHELGGAIVQGKYHPADGLPSEAEICETYKISRTATREAVKMLAAKGLIISRPRQGISIQGKEHWNLFDPEVLSWMLAGLPSLTMLKDFLQLRLAIEPQAASLAAQIQQREKIEDIEYALSRMKNAEQGLDDGLTADIEFHVSILLASGNPFIIQLRSFIETALRVSIRFTNKFKGVAAANYHEHDALYQAILAGNPQQAHAQSHKLLSEALTLIEQKLAEEDQN